MHSTSKYDDGKSLFIGPNMTQYDGHMIMSNVTKPTKRKYINIDTSFRDEYSDYNSTSLATCTITLPDRINDVKTLVVRNMEMPMTIYNISSAIGNNCFQILSGANSAVVTIPDGNYDDLSSFASAVNTAIQSLSAGFHNLRYAIVNNRSVMDASSGSYTVNFAISSNGSTDNYNLKRKLGWALGFRQPSYPITTSRKTSEGFVDLTGLRYLYLVVDEFTRGNQNSFIAPLTSSLVRKNILARIALNKATWQFGTVITANNYNGYLLSDHRNYSGKVDLQKLNIQLVDDIGNPVNLNGMDFSFCLEVEHE